MIKEEYNDCHIMDHCTYGKRLNVLSIQYRETDWEYIIRLASHFHTGITPSSVHHSPVIFFGNVPGRHRGQLKHVNYNLTKDLIKYMKWKKNSTYDFTERDALSLSMKSNQSYNIGDQFIFENQEMYIISKKTEMVKGMLVFSYDLTTKNGLWKERIYNERIVGVSLLGEVLERDRDKVKVHLEIDSVPNPVDAWLFPYATMYSANGSTGLYCMPEIGDMVNIYFPDKEEKQAFVLDSIRVYSTADDKIHDPDVKYFRTSYGKEFKFSKDEICITCCDKKGNHIYIKLNDGSGIELCSSEPIWLKSGKNITLQAKKDIRIEAMEELCMRGKSGEIVVNSKIEINGDDVRIN